MNTNGDGRAHRVLLVDRMPAIREALAGRIAQQPDLEVCGQTADACEAMRLIAATKPDAAVIDIDLKTGNGIDLIKRAKVHSHCPVFVVWSGRTNALFADRALRAGALGYVTKDQGTEVVITALRPSLAGKVYISADLSAHMMERVVGRDGKGSPMETLSDRELQAFELMGHGLTTVGMAERMKISTKTIETYRVRIKEKLKIDNVNELIRAAVEWVSHNGVPEVYSGPMPSKEGSEDRLRNVFKADGKR